jgi:hypothetical protein
MQITYCPPSLERRPNSQTQFIRPRFPVEARYVGVQNAPDSNGWKSTGLSFSDYGNMQTQRRKGNGRGGRRLSTPEYMEDPKRFRSVIIRYLELRVCLNKKQLGTDAERMQQVSARLKQKAEAAIVHLDKFCALYVAATDDAERKHLQRRISEYDSAVRLYREPWCIPQMARTFYWEGLDSVAVGARVGFKSPHVRQILYRLSQLDAEMQAGTDVPARRPRASHHASYYHRRRHVKLGIVSPKCAFCAAAQLSAAEDKRERKLEYMRKFMENRREAARTIHGKQKMTLTEVTSYAGTVSNHKRWHAGRGIVNQNCELCRALPEQSACLPSFPTSLAEAHLYSEQAQGAEAFA